MKALDRQGIPLSFMLNVPLLFLMALPHIFISLNSLFLLACFCCWHWYSRALIYPVSLLCSSRYRNIPHSAILLLMDDWVVSSCLLLQSLLLWLFLLLSAGEHIEKCLCLIYLGVELLGHEVVIAFLDLWHKAKLFANKCPPKYT